MNMKRAHGFYSAIRRQLSSAGTVVLRRNLAPVESAVALTCDRCRIRRGLSSDYVGKLKSYWVEDARELGKKEHPVNKRRRLLVAHDYPDAVTHDHDTSASGDGGGMAGSGDDKPEDKKGKGIIRKNIPEDSPLTSSSSDEESDESGVGGKSSGTLNCLASLEASLPMKRGLSSNYLGKSKSYGNLRELDGVEDAKELGKELGKTEHPVNKRRRLLIAHEYPNAVTHDATSASSPAILPHGGRKDKDEDGKDGHCDSEKKQEEDGK